MAAGITHALVTTQPNNPSYDVSANAWNNAHTVANYLPVPNQPTISTNVTISDGGIVLGTLTMGSSATLTLTGRLVILL